MSDPAALARKIFFNSEEELRSGWRVLVFIFLFGFLLLILGSTVATIISLFPNLSWLLNEPDPTESANEYALLPLGINSTVALLAALSASFICARLLERRSFGSTGFKLHAGWLRDFGLGLLLGTATLALAVAVTAVAGALEFGFQTTDAGLLATRFFMVGAIIFVAAAYEEVLFRGYIFQALLHNLGAAPAVAITSIAFAVLHLNNPSISVFSALNIALAGVWLGVAYLKTRSLWLATALHFSWNFAMVFIFGLPVSGVSVFDRLSWLDGQPGSPVWLSGGDFGPEGGAAATLAVLISTLVLWKNNLLIPSPEMVAETGHGKKEADPARPIEQS